MSCSVCNNLVRKAGIDAALAKGLSAAAISRENEETGYHVSPETIIRHRRHYMGDEKMQSEIAKTPKDFAIMVRDRAVELFEDEDGLSLMNKDHVPGISAGLKAQDVIDKRAARPSDRAALLAVAIALIGGEVPKDMLGLDDGNTIEGEAVEIDP